MQVQYLYDACAKIYYRFPISDAQVSLHDVYPSTL
jgi:hypothetical protein